MIMRDYDELIAALRRAWLDQNLTLREIGERIGGRSAQSVSATLNGNTEALGRRLFTLANALGYDLALIPREEP